MHTGPQVVRKPRIEGVQKLAMSKICGRTGRGDVWKSKSTETNQNIGHVRPEHGRSMTVWGVEHGHLISVGGYTIG